MTILPDGTLGLLWEREIQGLYFHAHSAGIDWGRQVVAAAVN